MVVSADILRELGACEEGIKYIERFYPNGAEIIDIIHDRHIDKSFLHWGREHLNISEEDLKAYFEVCRVCNSEAVWYSTDIKNSSIVVESKNVDNSSNIFKSTKVVNSTDVVESSQVADSKQIFYSSMIEECQKLYKTKNALNSTNVCLSTMVARSNNVIDSFNIFDSSEIIESNNVSNSHFCVRSKNIKNCLFCDGLENAEYHIFNQAIEPSHYEIFLKQYQRYICEELAFMKNWPENLIVGATDTPTKRIDLWYKNISNDFWEWVKTIPGYDPLALYRMTMVPTLLS